MKTQALARLKIRAALDPVSALAFIPGVNKFHLPKTLEKGDTGMVEFHGEFKSQWTKHLVDAGVEFVLQAAGSGKFILNYKITK